MKKKTITRKRVETTTTYELTKDDILKYLVKNGVVFSGSEVEVFVRVPGGGDWSNTDLEITDTENPIKVVVHRSEAEDTAE